MARVAVFHHISDEKKDFHNSLEQILAFDGVITFDGVYTSVFDHRNYLWGKSPILFITGNQIGRDGYCNKEQLLQLKSLGFRLGWHGWSHTKLTELDKDAIASELWRPKWIENIYAYPHGDYDLQTQTIVEDMGYKKAYSTTQGEEGNDFAIPRVYI